MDRGPGFTPNRLGRTLGTGVPSGSEPLGGPSTVPIPSNLCLHRTPLRVDPGPRSSWSTGMSADPYVVPRVRVSGGNEDY